ncbi:hypothetical protein SO3561_05598 [Streptomyces olivochromogenes]|uniref:Uncharacterized protein n=1 Tax=Streptomyces olivochromogenes TaxID=1963 RepID=A0A250VIY6_STROL|nr:hypothetical protein SO3561_05598 [Streptomyces olivochromogenes]
MTAPRSPRLDCPIPAMDGPQDAERACGATGVGAREKFARQGVLSALPTVLRIAGTARCSDRRYAA